MESLNMNVIQKSKPLNNDQNKIDNTQETININSNSQNYQLYAVRASEV